MRIAPSHHRPTGGTVAIVTCHNYGRFLRICLETLMQQTRPFQQIILVDDGSDDNTCLVAADFVGFVTYVHGEWRNFTEARKAGVAAMHRRAPFLLFVDADNYLSQNFHELLFEEMTTPKIGVVYSTVQVVDQFGRKVHEMSQAYSYDNLRRNNFADACSLIRTEAFEQVGGWEHQSAGLTDWLLWLKITRFGWEMVLCAKATLYYRMHGTNMLAGNAHVNHIPHNVQVWKLGCVITIVTLFSGRAWQLARYINALRALNWPKDGLRIVAVDNACDSTFTQLLCSALNATGIVWTRVEVCDRVLCNERASDVADSANLRNANAYAINVHLARLYAMAAQNIPRGTDAVWCLEDDIQPPVDTLEHFVGGLYVNSRAGVVCGVVKDRFVNPSRLLGWKGRFDVEGDGFSLLQNNNSFGHLTKPPPKGTYEKITASGFMCTFFRREVWDALSFRPAPHFDSPHCYYDWAAAHSVEVLGWEWYMSGSVRCLHWQFNGCALEVLDEGETSHVTNCHETHSTY